ncbi:MAG: deoxyribodipyrimidine photo-lyase [Bacteroidota bacterium]
MKNKVTLFWFRRDLRIEDNAALYYALKDEYPVQPVFIFDRDILDKLEDKDDARVTFIHGEIERLSKEFKERGVNLDVRYGIPEQIWKDLSEDYDIGRLYANKDYEPYARKRDKAVYEFFEGQGVKFIAKKDQVIFEKNEILKADGTPYKVYTPYSKLWKKTLTEYALKPYPSEQIDNWHQSDSQPVISLAEMGFEPSTIEFPQRQLDKSIVSEYHEKRDLPSVRGTSRLSVHLRFGTISIRKLANDALALNEKYLNELIWRDFYASILWHFPDVVEHNFNRKYDGVQWRNSEEDFKKWCEGKTGYPIVDAGMRELNATGFMHNRVRMITASFLTKHLLLDWRWGEAYFARKLLDFDLASNNGGWQWAAGTGVDAQPYFRVFNPTAQMEKFDKKLRYVRKWVPDFQNLDYKPMVDHKMARQRAIDTYKEGIV